MADDAAKKHGVPSDWVKAIIQTESAWNKAAWRSEEKKFGPGVGSRGLMQIMPDTARGLGFSGALDNLYDPATNIDVGTKLIRQLVDRYGENFEDVYAAYNSGQAKFRHTDTQVAGHVAAAVRNLKNLTGQDPRSDAPVPPGRNRSPEQLAAASMGGQFDFGETLSMVEGRVRQRFPGLFPDPVQAPDWQDIAIQLDPDLPQKDFDNIRENYFATVVAPKIRPGYSVEGTRQEWMKNTARTPMLGPSEQVLVQAGLAAIAGTKSMLPGMAEKLVPTLATDEAALRKMADRDGIETAIPEMAGTIVGMAPAIATLYGGANAMTAGLVARYGLSSAKARSLLTVARGGAANGVYEAMAAEEGDRVSAGLTGFAIGGLLDLGLAKFLGFDIKMAEKVVAGSSAGKRAVGGAVAEPVVYGRGPAALPPSRSGGTVAGHSGAAEINDNLVRFLQQELDSGVLKGTLDDAYSMWQRGVYRGADGVVRKLGVDPMGNLVIPERQLSNIVDSAGNIPESEMAAAGVIEQSVREARTRGYTKVPLQGRTDKRGLGATISYLGKTFEVEYGDDLTKALTDITAALDSPNGSLDAIWYGSGGKAKAIELIRSVADLTDPEAPIRLAVKDPQGLLKTLHSKGIRAVIGTEGEVVILNPKAPKLEKIIRRTGGDAQGLATPDNIWGHGADSIDDDSKIMLRIGAIRAAIRASGQGVGSPVPRALHAEMHHLQGNIAQKYGINSRAKVGQIALEYVRALNDGEAFSALDMLKKYSKKDLIGVRPPLGNKYPRIKGLTTIDWSFDDFKKANREAAPEGIRDQFDTPEMEAALREEYEAIKRYDAHMEKLRETNKLAKEPGPEPPLWEDFLRANGEDPESMDPERMYNLLNDYVKQHGFNPLKGFDMWGLSAAMSGDDMVRRQRELERLADLAGGDESFTARIFELLGMERNLFAETGHESVIRAGRRTVTGAQKYLDSRGAGGMVFTDASPAGRVRLLGDLHRDAVWHETMHYDLDWLVGSEEAGLIAAEESIKNNGTLRTISKLLSDLFPQYADMPKSMLLNEAFTHAADAIRTNNYVKLADMGVSTSEFGVGLNGLLDDMAKVADKFRVIAVEKDELIGRQMERKMVDLMRRASGERALQISRMAKQAGRSVYWDAQQAKFAATARTTGDVGGSSLDSQIDEIISEIFDDSDELFTAAGHWDVRDRFPDDAMFRVANEGTTEITGVPPTPEIDPLVAKDLSLGAKPILSLVRPTFDWAASVEADLKRKGISVGFFDKMKAVDDAGSLANPIVDDMAEEVRSIMKASSHSDRMAYANIMELPESDWAQAAAAYGIDTPEHLAAIRQMKEWGAQYGFDLEDGLKKMRGVSTGAIDLEDAAPDVWIDAMRRGTLQPEDFHMGRIAKWITRERVNRDFLDEPYKAAKQMIDTKLSDGTYLFDDAMRARSESYLNYMKGRKDQSAKIMESAISRMMELVDEKFLKMTGKKLGLSEATGEEWMRRYLLFMNASLLGARPALVVRDLFDGIRTMVSLGPKAWGEGVMRTMTKEGFAEANKMVSIKGRTIGEVFGDITGDIIQGKWERRFDRLAEILLEPTRWGNNINRSIAYWGEKTRAMPAIAKYRADGNVDALIDSTGLGFIDEAPATRLIGFAADRTRSVEDVATEFAKAVNESINFAFRMGTQPGIQRTGMGRVFGQFGTWPSNYIEWSRRMGRQMVRRPAQGIPRLAAFAAAHAAAIQASEELFGVDTSNWVFTSPAGYSLPPTASALVNALESFQLSDRGARARAQLLDFPLVPIQMENIIQGIEGGEVDLVKLLGFRPSN